MQLKSQLRAEDLRKGKDWEVTGLRGKPFKKTQNGRYYFKVGDLVNEYDHGDILFEEEGHAIVLYHPQHGAKYYPKWIQERMDEVIRHDAPELKRGRSYAEIDDWLKKEHEKVRAIVNVQDSATCTDDRSLPILRAAAITHSIIATYLYLLIIAVGMFFVARYLNNHS